MEVSKKQKKYLSYQSNAYTFAVETCAKYWVNFARELKTDKNSLPLREELELLLNTDKRDLARLQQKKPLVYKFVQKEYIKIEIMHKKALLKDKGGRIVLMQLDKNRKELTAPIIKIVVKQPNGIYLDMIKAVK